jgi:hypothetical protein
MSGESAHSILMTSTLAVVKELRDIVISCSDFYTSGLSPTDSITIPPSTLAALFPQTPQLKLLLENVATTLWTDTAASLWTSPPHLDEALIRSKVSTATTPKGYTQFHLIFDQCTALKDTWNELQRIILSPYGGQSPASSLYLTHLGQHLLTIHSKLQQLTPLLTNFMGHSTHHREVTGKRSNVRQLLHTLQHQNLNT